VAVVLTGLALGGLTVVALRSDSVTLRSDVPNAAPDTEGPGSRTTLIPTTAVAAPPSPSTTPTPTTAPPTTLPSTTLPPPSTALRLTPDSRLSVDGLGPVRIGMTLAEASAAAGVTIRLYPEQSGGLDCTYAHPVNDSDEMAFMVVAGRIVRIDIGRLGPNRVRTLSGIGRDSTEADVLKTYPGQIRVEPHPYVRGAHNLVYVPGDPAFRQYSMIFESVDGRVTAFRSGLTDPVSWTEGCS